MQENLLKECFGGKLIQQVISKECPHISEREEDFFAIQVGRHRSHMNLKREASISDSSAVKHRMFSALGCLTSDQCTYLRAISNLVQYTQCEVKNKKSVDESLQLYIKEEVLEGDNKYLCAQCDKKVNAAKRYGLCSVSLLTAHCANTRSWSCRCSPSSTANYTNLVVGLTD